MKTNILAAAAACLLVVVLSTWTVRAEDKPKDGFYATVRVSQERQSLLPLANDELLLQSSPRFLDDGDKPEYVVVRKEPWVPLQLKAKPEKTKDRTDRTRVWLLLHLTDDAARKFEDFTSANLGKGLAVVVDGEVVSRHGIKSVIKDGRIQISRCGDNRCEQLYVELTKDVKAPSPSR